VTPARFAKLKAVLERRQPDLTVLCEDVHKSHNISAILRTCDAVGVAELHAVSPGGEFTRHHMVSGGSRKWVRTRAHRDIGDAARLLKSSGFQIVAAHLSGSSTDYRRCDFTRPTAVLLGAELAGVSDRAAALADLHLAIPMRGHVESLNVSVAAALILYEAARQREAAGLYARCRLDEATYRELLFEWSYPAAARHCRAKAIPYPTLDAQGFMVSARAPTAAELARALRAERLAQRKARRTSGAVS
jgi:tRNA (guanosine-2'-O-)-methyltransferase